MSALQPELLEPLTRLHGAVIGTFEGVEPESVPEPFRALLVHNGDMTSRLEAFHQGAISLEVLQSLRSGEDAYCREVILRRATDGAAVEYGAIEIFLDAFDAPVRDLILAGTIPLGGLLNAHHVQYHSEPQAFFRMSPDPVLAGLLGTSETAELYGRCNILRHDGGPFIARIVEVLPPI